MTTALVTGVAGFLGSHVADELLKMGHNVIGVDDMSGGFIENVPNGALFWRADIGRPEFIEWLFEGCGLFPGSGIDYVYHCAAYAAEGLSHFIRRFNYTNNLIGSVNLINAAVKHNVKCFVFTSSIAVYGSQTPPFTEDMTPRPEDPYGIAKYAVEMDLEAAHRMFGLPYIIFRPHNVYGERQNISDPYRNVVGIFMRQCLENEPLTIFGDGSQVRAFTYVGDIAPVIAQSVENPEATCKTFNVGARMPCTVSRLAEMVEEAVQRWPGVYYLPAREEVGCALSSDEAAAQVFGWKEETPLATGLLRMADWVKTAPRRPRQKFDNIEIERGLPPSWK